jgi:hypothetical protein
MGKVSPQRLTYPQVVPFRDAIARQRTKSRPSRVLFSPLLPVDGAILEFRNAAMAAVLRACVREACEQRAVPARALLRKRVKGMSLAGSAACAPNSAQLNRGVLIDQPMRAKRACRTGFSKGHIRRLSQLADWQF